MPPDAVRDAATDSRPDPPPDPPPDPLDASDLVYLLGLSFQQLFHTFMGRLAAAGYPDLRPAHGFVLRALAREGATGVELAAQLGVTKQAVGQLLDYLEAEGYVERRPHPLGGRRRLVVLSPYGRQHLADADAIMHAVEAGWTAPLDDARLRELRGMLTTLIRASVPADTLPPLRPAW